MKDWLPNGENKEEYPQPAQTHKWAWAWEYLRRNEEYQKAYESFITFLNDNGFPECDWEKKLKCHELIHQITERFYVSYIHGIPDPSLSFQEQPDMFFRKELLRGPNFYTPPVKSSNVRLRTCM